MASLPRQWPNPAAARRIQLYAGLRRDGVASGKFTKRWQYRAAAFEHKTRQAKPVTRRALQLHNGVGVACQHSVRGVSLRVVASSKRADQIRLINHTDVQAWGWVASAAVMVAAYQRASQLRMAITPGCHLAKHRRCTGLARMQKIT